MSETNTAEEVTKAELLATRLEGAMGRLLLARARFYLTTPAFYVEEIGKLVKEIDAYFESLHGGGAVR